MRIRPLHFKVDLISSLILEKNVKNVDFPILIYSIAPKSGAIQQVGNSREHAQNPCGLSGLTELEGKMAEFYVTE